MIKTISQFHDKAVQLAISLGTKFASIYVQTNFNGDIEYKVYIDGFGMQGGNSPEDAISAMENSVKGIKYDLDILPGENNNEEKAANVVKMQSAPQKESASETDFQDETPIGEALGGEGDLD